MYYLYGIEDKVAMLIDVGQLSDIQKTYATTFVNELPSKLPHQEGSVVKLFIDPETLEASYVYRDQVEEEEINQKIEDLFK